MSVYSRTDRLVRFILFDLKGSGKTFTMEGAGNVSLDNPDAGMIPRAVQQIYSACEALKGINYEIMI
jgi:Kinesin motor domain